MIATFFKGLFRIGCLSVSLFRASTFLFILIKWDIFQFDKSIKLHFGYSVGLPKLDLKQKQVFEQFKHKTGIFNGNSSRHLTLSVPVDVKIMCTVKLKSHFLLKGILKFILKEGSLLET